ncbi:protein of unknown function DUF1703 [Methanospirillum hungatei JF-1]|uniref:AAA-ATPase-like domain-containing protein n=2 Tax=Methanospirillum hungatei TaxID=2203 RepID=Q2FRK8_METHJ|nr:protein of unknown function DUF1703 [Methanospirillum hungatei JF-1]
MKRHMTEKKKEYTIDRDDMIPKFRVGTDDFKKLRDEGGYFVDKTLFIKEIIDGNEVTLIPRPRRFGKTLNMTMLRYFFERSEESRAYLFDSCAIADYPMYMEHQGQYPVIFLSLKDLKRDSYDHFIKATKAEIGRLYREYLPISKSLPEASRDRYLRICREESPDHELYNSLKELISHCYSFYKKPVIVLIDEYDTPMIEAFSKGYYNEMSDFMRSWLGAGLKPEQGQVLYRAVITGILRIAKESIFSDLNNLDVASPLMIGPYADKFGFTEQEVSTILTAFEVENHADIIRDWYNGYSFGGHTIYNPWSLISYIQAIPNPPSPKWLNTSSNALVYEELASGGLEIKRDLEVLLSGEELRYPLSENITFGDIGKNPANIWSLLYYSGYLKADDPKFAEYDPNLLTYSLSIPNREIFLAYRQFVNRLFETRTMSAGIKDFISYFLENKIPSVLEQTLSDLTLGLVSMYDVAKLPEAVFHAFVLGLLANLRNVYEIRSNVEAGYGRADILMIPKTGTYSIGYIIECKSVKKEGDGEKAAADGLAQIREKEYMAALVNAGVPLEKIVKLAVTLQGKRVTVKKE